MHNAHEKSAILEIIYSDQKQLPRGGHDHDFQWNSEHAWTYEIAPILEALFRYIDLLSLPETPYVTGRPPISKKSLLKCFILKTNLFCYRFLAKISAHPAAFSLFSAGLRA
jgi:hypothetical protein